MVVVRIGSGGISGDWIRANMTVLPFTSSWARHASQEYKESVVKRTLEQLKDSPEAHRDLGLAINAVVKVAGFRNSSTAPVPRLIKPVVRQLDFSNDLAAEVLKAWAKSRQPLHDAVAARLAESGISADYPDFANGGFRGLWRAGELRREHDAILERHAEFESEDALLMLCYATGRMPSDDDAAPPRPPTGVGNAPENALNAAVLSQWKLALNSLPLDSPLWDNEIPDFVSWVNETVEEKENERNDSRKLRDALLDMQERFAQDLSYLGVSVEWDMEGFVSFSNASVASELAGELASALNRYKSLPTRGATYEETLRLRATERERVEEIRALSGELDKILASPRRPDDEPPPKPKSAAAESDGGDSAPPDISDAPPRQDAADASPSAADDGGASVPDGEDALGDKADSASETELDGEEADGDATPDAPADDSAGGAEDGSEPSADDAGEDRDAAPEEEIAGDAESEDDSASPDKLESAMWEMVGEDDLSGAYWTARSMEAQGIVLPAPSRLFAAAQGAKWLSPNSDAYVEDLFEIVSGPDPDKSDAQKLMGLAAALQASVIKPETNLAAWLDSPDNCQRVERVVAPIREFKDFGTPARPEDIDGSDGIEGLRNAIVEASADAREWLEESLNRSHTYPRATAVFRNLCRDDVAQQMLAPAANDERGYAERVKAIAEDMERETSAASAVDRIHQSISTGSSSRLSPIVAHARNWLVGNIQEAARKALRWCYLVERENKSASGGNEWWMEQVSNLRGGIAANSEDAFVELDELRSDSEDAATSAAAVCVARSLARLLAYLRLTIPESAALPAASAAAEDLDAIAADRADRLETAMGRRLIWTPSARLGDDCLPAPAGFAEMGRRLSENRDAPITLSEALKRRVEDPERQDYRFYDIMSVRLSEKERADMESMREKARKESEEALRARVKESRESLDQASIDGVMERDDNEWQEYNGQINEIAPEGDNASLDHVLNFGAAHERITDIETGLENKKTERRDELRLSWDELALDVRRRANDNDDDTDAVKDLEGDFSQAESKLDIRVMDVCVDRLREHLMFLESGGREGDRLVRTRDNPDASGTFESFLDFINGIQNPETYSASILTNAR